MKKSLLTIAVLLLAGTAFAQERLLQWDQLMDRNLYPQREMMSFIFAPDGKTVTYYKGGEDKGFYGFDGKKEFKLTEAQQDWRKPKDSDPKLEERVEKKARVSTATSSASTAVSSGRPRPAVWPSIAWTRAWWWTIRW